MRVMRYAALMILVGLLVVGVAPVFGQCDTTNGADDVTCSTDVVTFDGQGGADTLVVADGTTVDTFAGGNGADTMTNNGAAFGMEGDGGDDTMINNGLVFIMEGNGGRDTMTNNEAAFGMVGGNRADTMTNNGSVFVMDGGDGRDTMVNNGTVEVMYGEDRADTMTNNGDVVVMDGGGGHDTMTNNGVVAVDMYGDEGRDTIVNNGTVGNDIEGEEGRDTIVNNGVVEDDIEGGAGKDIIINNGVVGDDVEGNDGADHIENNGTVGEDIEGGLGNDVIILGEGSVTEGGVFGNYNTADSTEDNAGRSNDTVIIQTGARVDGIIDGGEPDGRDNDTDTLIFDIEVGAEFIEETARRIAAANPDGGTITINGQVYTWTNFEGLVDLLRLAMFHDGRLNAFDFWATSVAYCADGGFGVSLYTVGGEFVGTAMLGDLYAAPVGGVLIDRLGIGLSWLGDDVAMMTGPDGYAFVFDPVVCAH